MQMKFILTRKVSQLASLKWEILEVGNGLQGWNGTELIVTSFTSARELFTIC